MSTPMDWQPSKAIQAKTGATKKNHSPVDRKPERAIQAKMGWLKRNKKNEKTDMQKALTTDAMSEAFTWLSQQAAIPFRLFFTTILQLPTFKRWSRCIFERRHPQKRKFCKYMSEHEPLRAQYSNVLSVSAKLCLQIANHHAFQSIHTCIIMHPTCSCIR